VSGPRVLLLGARGRLGEELARVLGPWTDLRTAGRSTADHVALDLTSPDEVLPALTRAAPQVVVNAAGYVDVDKAEREPDAAFALNAAAPAALATACDALGALLVHVGSDYVFDGRLGRPYTEDDRPRPLSVYGRSKWQGEQAVLAARGPHLVLRTSWVFAAHRPCWLTTFRELLARPEPMRVVADQRGSPTWARSFAEALDAVLRRLRGVGPQGDLDPARVRGLYHVADAGGATWHELALAVKELLRLPAPVAAVSRADVPQPAVRPADSRLDARRLGSIFGVTLPSWRAQVEACIAS
jgi:dTDP-4-dehydrorhamnose reductase